MAPTPVNQHCLRPQAQLPGTLLPSAGFSQRSFSYNGLSSESCKKNSGLKVIGKVGCRFSRHVMYSNSLLFLPFHLFFSPETVSRQEIRLFSIAYFLDWVGDMNELGGSGKTGAGDIYSKTALIVRIRTSSMECRDVSWLADNAGEIQF